MSNEPVSVRILDREYTVGVTAEERESLTAAARLLDLRMREIRGSNRMAAVDRVAVLAALNLAHELQQLREQQAVYERELANTLDSMNRRLDGVIDTPRRSAIRTVIANMNLQERVTDEWASHRGAEVYNSPAFSAVNDGVQNIRLVP